MREVILAFPFKNLSKIPKGHQDNSLARRNQNELRSGVRGCCPAAKRRKDRSPGRQPWVSVCDEEQPWKGGIRMLCRPFRACSHSTT